MTRATVFQLTEFAKEIFGLLRDHKLVVREQQKYNSSGPYDITTEYSLEKKEEKKPEGGNDK
jgi:hypothetical protein